MNILQSKHSKVCTVFHNGIRDIPIFNGRILRPLHGEGHASRVLKDVKVQPHQRTHIERRLSGWRPRPFYNHALHGQWQSTLLSKEEQKHTDSSSWQRRRRCKITH